MSNIVIVEGCDNVGKTTVAKHLADELSYEYHHCGAPSDENSAMDEYFDLLNRPNDIILDRSWIGDLVYAPTLRGYYPSYMTELVKGLKQNGTRVLALMLYAPREKLDKMPVDKSDLKMMAEHETYQKRFITEFNGLKYCEKMVFNIANFVSVKEELERITSFVWNWEKKNTVFTPFVDDYSLTMFNRDFRYFNPLGQPEPSTVCGNIMKCDLFKSHIEYGYGSLYKEPTGGAGNLSSSVVLIGEAPGRFGCGKLGIPFYNDKSGMLLREAMFWNRVLESEVYITNAVKCNPKDNKILNYDATVCKGKLSSELSCLSPGAKFVSLGRTAEWILNTLKVPNTYMAHPASALYTRFDYIAYFKEKFGGEEK